MAHEIFAPSYPPPLAGEVDRRSTQCEGETEGGSMRIGEEPAREKAKQLRRSMTKAEVILWMGLRALRSDGYNFRRQHPVGPYIADFAIHSGKLVIEVDGATHDAAHEVRHDRKRDVYLRSKGWCVLRIPNVAVYEDIEHVIATILSQIPPPALRATSPASGGG